jgi:hypothetical protein
VYESKRTQVIEWRCSDCGAVLKSRHDKLGGEYNKRTKRGNLSPKPSIWIRKGNYRELLYFEIGRRLYAFRSIDVERLERDEILAIPVYQVCGNRNWTAHKYEHGPIRNYRAKLTDL